MKKSLFLIILIVKILFITINGYGQSGVLDVSFDSDGYLYSDIEGNDDYVTDMVLQDDGKIIVAGFTNTGIYKWFLARYNSDGSIDTDFNSGGYVISIDGTNPYIDIQSDGKIIIGGTSLSENRNDVFTLQRFNTNGSLDSEFGTDGTVTTQIGIEDASIADLIIQSDGKIVAVGYGIKEEVQGFATVRYNPDGTLDSEFGDNGSIISTIGLKSSNANSVAVQNDNKIIVAGSVRDDVYFEFAVVRYNSDGTLDESFGNTGIAKTPIGEESASLQDVAILDDGKIIVGGHAEVGNFFDFALVRYNTDGSLDDSFDEDGKVLTEVTSNYDMVREILIQDDGKILAIGDATFGADYEWGFARYNIDGSLDNNFGTDGIQISDINSSRDVFVRGAALTEDGKILVAGFWDKSSEVGDTDIIMGRYLNENEDVDTVLGNTTASVGESIIYPSPAQNYIVLKGLENVEGNIYTVSGKLVRAFKQSNAQLDISRLDKGIYIIEFVNNNKPTVMQFIKE